jgi:hypothetical protein
VGGVCSKVSNFLSKMVKGEKDVAKAWLLRRRLVRCDLDDDSLRRVIALDLRLMRRLQHVPLELTHDAVMAVLVTAIHVFAARQDVDARDKPAHDGVIPCDRTCCRSSLHRRPLGIWVGIPSWTAGATSFG